MERREDRKKEARGKGKEEEEEEEEDEEERSREAIIRSSRNSSWVAPGLCSWTSKQSAWMSKHKVVMKFVLVSMPLSTTDFRRARKREEKKEPACVAEVEEARRW